MVQRDRDDRRGCRQESSTGVGRVGRGWGPTGTAGAARLSSGLRRRRRGAPPGPSADSPTSGGGHAHPPARHQTTAVTFLVTGPERGHPKPPAARSPPARHTAMGLAGARRPVTIVEKTTRKSKRAPPHRLTSRHGRRPRRERRVGAAPAAPAAAAVRPCRCGESARRCRAARAVRGAHGNSGGSVPASNRRAGSRPLAAATRRTAPKKDPWREDGGAASAPPSTPSPTPLCRRAAGRPNPTVSVP